MKGEKKLLKISEIKPIIAMQVKPCHYMNGTDSISIYDVLLNKYPD